MLIFAAVGEAGTGLALLIVPSLVGRLLLGEELTGIAIPVARVAGFALLALGLGCWPSREAPSGSPPALRAMLTYNLLVTIYLFYLGVGGELVGWLLWPAAAAHAVLTFLLARVWLRNRQTQEAKP